MKDTYYLVVLLTILGAFLVWGIVNIVSYIIARKRCCELIRGIGTACASPAGGHHCLKDCIEVYRLARRETINLDKLTGGRSLPKMALIAHRMYVQELRVTSLVIFSEYKIEYTGNNLEKDLDDFKNSYLNYISELETEAEKFKKEFLL